MWTLKGQGCHCLITLSFHNILCFNTKLMSGNTLWYFLHSEYKAVGPYRVLLFLYVWCVNEIMRCCMCWNQRITTAAHLYLNEVDKTIQNFQNVKSCKSIDHFNRSLITKCKIYGNYYKHLGSRSIMCWSLASFEYIHNMLYLIKLFSLFVFHPQSKSILCQYFHAHTLHTKCT